MPSANLTSARMERAVMARDSTRVVRCLSAYVHRVIFQSTAERDATTQSILSAMSTMHHDANVVGGGLCALTNISTNKLPINTVLRCVKPHETNVQVIRAAARLLKFYADGPHGMDDLPLIVQTTAHWVQVHAFDNQVAHYAACVVIQAAGMIPKSIADVHGSMGVDHINVSIVQGAMASKVMNYLCNGVPWQAFVINNLFPTLRG